MENEIGSAVRISAMLVASAALIAIVWFTVVIGNNVKYDSYNAMDKVKTSISNTQLSSMSYKDNLIIPKAAAYNLVAQESDFIVSLEYHDALGNDIPVKFGEDKWEIRDADGKVLKSFANLQDVIGDAMIGKVEIYIEPTMNDTFKVKISDLA